MSMLTIGEVHTGLVQHQAPLSQAQSERILQFQEGEVVLLSQRPTTRAASPTRFFGVDCLLPSHTNRQVRCAGTISYQAIITGGRVLQGSSNVKLVSAQENRRLPWSHYLARPGTTEAIAKADWADVAEGYVRGRAVPDTLDVGGVSGRAMDTVQRSRLLDRRPPFRAQRTCLRWVIRQAAGDPTITFSVRSDVLRTVELSLPDTQFRDGIALCEDLALHDWLLTTVGDLLEVTRTSSRPDIEKIGRLRPAVEHLLHLWAPGARVSPSVRPIWDLLEQRPGFTHQWNASVNWIRDQIAVGTIGLMQTLLPRLGDAEALTRDPRASDPRGAGSLGGGPDAAGGAAHQRFQSLMNR